MPKDIIEINVGSDDCVALQHDGTLYATAYSYEIDSTGEITLSKEQTRDLYEAMKKYYEK